MCSSSFRVCPDSFDTPRRARPSVAIASGGFVVLEASFALRPSEQPAASPYDRQFAHPAVALPGSSIDYLVVIIRAK